jgi:glutathione S-transferase
MKLYYAPGACSQAPHIALHEAGLPHSSTRVDLKAKRTEDGQDYWGINPKGSVPAVQLDNGQVLTENAAILQYIADHALGSNLLPPVGDVSRYRVLEWLNYVATELHKGFGPLWNPASSDEVKQSTRDLLAKKFDFVQQQLGDGPFLTGDVFTIADAYLFVILGWTGMHGIDLSRWAGLTAFRKRGEERPAVLLVLEAEGLAGAATAG